MRAISGSPSRSAFHSLLSIASWGTSSMRGPSKASRDHHCVYVVYLRNPKGDGKAGYYVGMTGLAPVQRFKNHKQGIKAAGVVKRCGERLVPRPDAPPNPKAHPEAGETEGARARNPPQ